MLILGGLRDVNVIFTRNIRSPGQRWRSKVEEGKGRKQKIGVGKDCSDRLEAEK